MQPKQKHILFCLLAIIATHQVYASHAEATRTHEWVKDIHQSQMRTPEQWMKLQGYDDYLPTAVEQCSPQFIENVIPLSKYYFDTHKVTTEDGYILSLFRLRYKAATPNGKVVFLQHGLNNDAGTWVINGEDKALAFLLAKKGFDVWMGNNRGNKYSRSHVNLNPNKAKFWEFSFDEKGRYDIPANLNYVNQHTGGAKIIYIGYSQGTTQMFVALSDAKIRPKVAPLIKVFYALAPILYLDQNKVPVTNYVTYLTNTVKNLAWAFGLNYFELGTCKWDQAKVDKLNKKCGDNPKNCYLKLRLTDEDPSVDNWARDGYRELLGQSGASTRAYIHYAQIIKAQIKNKKAFPKFDYGPITNLVKYRRFTPPNYDLSLVREPVRLWVGNKDTLGTVPETERIHRDLVNADSKIQVLDRWGHGTFNFAKDVTSYYIDKLIPELEQF